MEGDMSCGAEMGFQGLLNLAGAGMGGAEGEGAVHADVQLDGVAAADATGAQVVWVVHVGERGDDVEYLAFHLVGQGGFEQFVDALLEEFPRHAEDEEGDDERRQGV